jgi:hypothetical protein
LLLAVSFGRFFWPFLLAVSFGRFFWPILSELIALKLAEVLKTILSWSISWKIVENGPAPMT